MYGSNHLLASSISGLIAFFLTGTLALIDNRLKIENLIIRGGVFLFWLFIFAVLWKNSFNLLHQHSTLSELRSYSVQQWMSGTSYAFYLFIAWAGLLLGSRYFLTNRAQQLALNQALLASKSAQLQSLRYQLNPHFLFNVLNSIDVSILAGDNETSHRMLNRLSNFLRSSLQHQERDKISLQKEINVMQDFIDIEKIRFGDAIDITIDISPECNSALIPPMLLLPLIENAIKFAWSQSELGQVRLKATKKEQQLFIQVFNSRTEYSDKKTGTGTGLRNTEKRLQVAYGTDATLEISQTDKLYGVEICLPWINRFR